MSEAVATEVAGGSAVRVYAETSTIGQESIERIAAVLAARGLGCVDSPVSGGPDRRRRADPQGAKRPGQAASLRQDATEPIHERREPAFEEVGEVDQVGLMVGDHRSPSGIDAYASFRRRTASRGSLRASRGQTSVSPTSRRRCQAAHHARYIVPHLFVVVDGGDVGDQGVDRQVVAKDCPTRSARGTGTATSPAGTRPRETGSQGCQSLSTPKCPAGLRL